MPGISYGDDDCLYFSGETLSGKTSFLKKRMKKKSLPLQLICGLYFLRPFAAKARR